jgi:hypothetical protein
MVGGLLALLLLSTAYSAAAHPGNRLVRRPTPSPVATESAAATDATRPSPLPAVAPAVSTCELPGLVAAPVTPRFPWILATAMLALAGVIHRSRRLAALASVLFLVVFVAESSVHSVHHLTDPQGAAQCQALSLAQHVHGSIPAGPTVGALQTDTGPLLITLADAVRADAPIRPDVGRAPPPLST